MNRLSKVAAIASSLVAFAGLLSTGCGTVDVGDLLAQIDLQLNNAVDRIQTEDPRTVELPPAIVDRGDTVIIEEDVVVIVSVQQQLVIE